MLDVPEPVAFEWDQGNKDKNWVKHRVSQKEAEEVFFDPHMRVTAAHKTVTNGYRWLLLGKTKLNRLLFIVFTLRNNQVRVISARDAHRKERPLYEKAA